MATRGKPSSMRTSRTLNSMARLRLKHVNAFRNRNRKDGRTRHYFRRRGQKAIPLPGLPGSDEFMAAYAMALAAIPDQPEIGEPTAKRHWLKAIRGLLRFAVPTMLKADPTEGIATVKLPKSKGHHTWTDYEIEQYRACWPLGTQQRLVMEFALETASRKGEVVRLGPQHVRKGRIRIERTHGSEDVDIPLSPELQAACDAMPKAHLTYIVTMHGKPRSKFGLGNDFAKWVTEAGLPARCRLHGLKKGGMRRLAEAGGTAHELMAFSGHKTLTEVQRYTTDADRKKLADSAMAKLRGRSENTNVTNIESPLHKQGANPLKTKGRSNELAVP